MQPLETPQPGSGSTQDPVGGATTVSTTLPAGQQLFLPLLERRGSSRRCAPSTGQFNQLFLPLLIAQLSRRSPSTTGHQVLPLLIKRGPESRHPPLQDGSTGLTRLIVYYVDGVQAAALDHVAQVQTLSMPAGVELTYVRELGDDALVVKLPEWETPPQSTKLAATFSLQCQK